MLTDWLRATSRYGHPDQTLLCHISVGLFLSLRHRKYCTFRHLRYDDPFALETPSRFRSIMLWPATPRFYPKADITLYVQLPYETTARYDIPCRFRPVNRRPTTRQAYANPDLATTQELTCHLSLVRRA